MEVKLGSSFFSTKIGNCCDLLTGPTSPTCPSAHTLLSSPAPTNAVNHTERVRPGPHKIALASDKFILPAFAPIPFCVCCFCPSLSCPAFFFPLSASPRHPESFLLPKGTVLRGRCHTTHQSISMDWLPFLESRSLQEAASCSWGHFAPFKHSISCCSCKQTTIRPKQQLALHASTDSHFKQHPASHMNYQTLLPEQWWAAPRPFGFA